MTRNLRTPRRWLLAAVLILGLAASLALFFGYSTEVNACALVDPAPQSCFPQRRLAVYAFGMLGVVTASIVGVVASFVHTDRTALVLTARRKVAAHRSEA